MSKPEAILDIARTNLNRPRQKISKSETVAPQGPDVKPITLEQLMNKDLPTAEWLVDGLVPVGLTVLSAQPAAYKTWLLLEIARSVASGTELFGRLRTKKMNVLVVDEESTENLLQQRLEILEVDKYLSIHFMIGTGFQLEKNAVFKLIKYCKKHEIQLITFDSLVRIHSGNENDAVQMAQVFQLLRRFQHHGISVLVTHHNRKSVSNSPSADMRGSSDILAAVDCHLAIQRYNTEKRIILTQSKVRIAEEISSVNLIIDTDGGDFRFKLDGDLTTSSMLHEEQLSSIVELLKGSAMNQKQLLDKLNLNGVSSTSYQLRKNLKELIDTGRIDPAQKGQKNEKIYSA